MYCAAFVPTYDGNKFIASFWSYNRFDKTISDNFLEADLNPKSHTWVVKFAFGIAEEDEHDHDHGGHKHKHQHDHDHDHGGHNHSHEFEKSKTDRFDLSEAKSDSVHLRDAAIWGLAEYGQNQMIMKESKGVLLLFKDWQCTRKFDKISGLGVNLRPLP